MASVPNRVYPLSEYREIRTDVLRAKTGSFATTISAPAHNFASTYTLPTIPSGSMNFGDLILATGASGTSALLYFKVKSGSGNAIYSIEGTYVSSGSA